MARAVRYAKEITIHVALQEDTGDGRIYPPYIEIDYGVATLDDYDTGSSLPVWSFDNEALLVAYFYNNAVL